MSPNLTGAAGQPEVPLQANAGRVQGPDPIQANELVPRRSPSPPLIPNTPQPTPDLTTAKKGTRGQDRFSSYSSYSTGSERRLGSSMSSQDRVFPISSVVRVDSSQTPSILSSLTKTPISSNYQDPFEKQDYFPPGHQGDLSPVDSSHAHTPRPVSRRRRTPSPLTSLVERKPKPVQSTDNVSVTKDVPRGRRRALLNAETDSERYGGGSRMQLFNDYGSEKSPERSPEQSLSTSLKGRSDPHTLTGANTSEDSQLGLHVTTRFTHQITAEGHAVITGRDGVALQRCEDEPIHMPGAVQGFGMLVCLEEQSAGELLVRMVSENSKRIIGYTPHELFRLKSFTEILSEEEAHNIFDHLDFVRDDDDDPAENGPEVFTICIKPPRPTRKATRLWCAMHIHPAYPDRIICEFELDDDTTHPLAPPGETPDTPEDTLDSRPTQEEYQESTINSSRPLRVLKTARKRRGEAAAMQVFNVMSQVQKQLAAAKSLDTFLKILVGVVKELTGFHRVMIYQFDSSFNGRVVTELVDPRATKDLYKGLNFPASDIPHQAREMYKINKVRLLYDRDLESARLVCRSVEDLELPLDLSHSYLRTMSPIHIKYLSNMAVRSSMSISINAFSELWGLVACHSYGDKGMRVSFPIRKMCRLIGDTASRNIEGLSYASRLQARKLINTVPTEANPAGYIIASSDDLLKLFDADFGLVSIKGQTKIMGKLEQSQEALAMLQYLRMRKITSVITSQDIKSDFPDLQYPPGFEVIAGLLLVPLSVGGSDFIVFLRKAQTKVVKWAGNPYEKVIKEGTQAYLEPRSSFKTWNETVQGKCREWTENHVETAAVLCLVYGKFIEVWRQKEAAEHHSQLNRLLLANSAHEVRTPLNAIINYLEIALEGALDQETRENLAKSHSASKSLIYVINDLLDLTKTEQGRDLITDEVFDLPATVRAAFNSFSGDAKRKGLEYTCVTHPGFPKLVLGDQRRIRTAVASIIANAIQHTSSGSIHVEMWFQGLVESAVSVEIACTDTGAGMSNEKLDSLFRDLEQVSSDGDNSLIGSEDSDQQKPRRVLGLGLAMVARLVRNMGGQLRLKSEEGNGSRFVMQLTFLIPDDDAVSSEEQRLSTPSVNDTEISTPPTAVTTAPPDMVGEVTLIGKTAKGDGIPRKRSLDGMTSSTSLKSFSNNGSEQSDVDRLIEAISSPLNVGEPESPERRSKRSNSREFGQDNHSVHSLPSSQPVGDSRPAKPSRSKSQGAMDLRSIADGFEGSAFITDTKTMLRAVRMPDDLEETDREPAVESKRDSRVLFDLPDDKPTSVREGNAKFNADHLQVLVAEDDPVNSKIIQKRLEKSGHHVHQTVNGEDCATVYANNPSLFDVVLMDMQMPIVDGLSCTKMIRLFEKTHPEKQLAPRASLNGRVPIFAVSASLLERERKTYINSGFDGWILKPIDFKRLNKLLEGIVDEKIQNSCLYRPGTWENGGWFQKRNASSTVASSPTISSPTATTPTSDMEKTISEGNDAAK
ncbi:hypothetical protein HYALB_00005957 [Hymenoscyphus albidus]|uniref:Uncharacterized protein n=1 Tax=Hymenoscyphus albidus TaxID=595503 RepID=A0A9N9Q160_9HELO|nr:hypothetical protein HYALB_00005957 [Hymenoscyphus albidus]